MEIRILATGKIIERSAYTYQQLLLASPGAYEKVITARGQDPLPLPDVQKEIPVVDGVDLIAQFVEPKPRKPRGPGKKPNS